MASSGLMWKKIPSGRFKGKAAFVEVKDGTNARMGAAGFSAKDLERVPPAVAYSIRNNARNVYELSVELDTGISHVTRKPLAEWQLQRTRKERSRFQAALTRASKQAQQILSRTG